MAHRPDRLCSASVLPADGRNRFFHGVCPFRYNGPKGAYGTSRVPHDSHAPGAVLPSPLEHPSFVGNAKGEAFSGHGFFAAFVFGGPRKRL